jgi:hypothetical protein
MGLMVSCAAQQNEWGSTVTRSNFFVAAIIAIAVTAGTNARGETALHNITGYTSSDAGMVEFSVLVFDDRAYRRNR